MIFRETFSFHLAFIVPIWWNFCFWQYVRTFMQWRQVVSVPVFKIGRLLELRALHSLELAIWRDD
jgi:hypothetical protein